MQKGKRYRDPKTGGLYKAILLPNGQVGGLNFPLGSRVRMNENELNELISRWGLVELPDDDLLWAPSGESFIRLPDGSLQINKQPPAQSHCDDHHYVNYTPYHDASPMAKFACSKCDKERS